MFSIRESKLSSTCSQIEESSTKEFTATTVVKDIFEEVRNKLTAQQKAIFVAGTFLANALIVRKTIDIVKKANLFPNLSSPISKIVIQSANALPKWLKSYTILHAMSPEHLESDKARYANTRMISKIFLGIKSNYIALFKAVSCLGILIGGFLLTKKANGELEDFMKNCSSNNESENLQVDELLDKCVDGKSFLKDRIKSIIFEEVLFRCILQNTFQRLFSAPVAVTMSGICFGATHWLVAGDLESEQQAIQATLFPVEAILYYTTGGPWASIAAHACHNATIFACRYLSRE